MAFDVVTYAILRHVFKANLSCFHTHHNWKIDTAVLQLMGF
jgi:hypothetical protein